MITETNTPLSLLKIAAWQVPGLLEEQDLPFVAELPSLQRESVWKPAQIELLWDSIFRGFPIGSLVISKYLGGQRFRSGSVARKGESQWAELPRERKRALLDGQQRCNAIALGFLDPQESGNESPPAILWIDLKPKLLANSTRKFLFRVTTKSHPWGYTKDDSATRLNTEKMRKLEGDSYSNRHGRNRLKPTELYPFDAELPVPLAWLLKFAPSKSDSKGIWDMVLKCCADAYHPWQKKVYDELSKLQDDADLQASLKRIESGLASAKQCSVVALGIPDEALDLEAADSVAGSGEDPSISCIGILFKRLNNGGTPIAGPDLTYSMIKANWPGVEERIDGVKRQMSASGLFQIGARAAADEPNSIILHPGFSIPQLRQIARGGSEKDSSLRKLMLHYFGISADGNASAAASPFVEGVSRIESWLLYRSGTADDTDDIGLPPLVRSQIVQRSPKTYLLLLILAKRYPKEQEGAGDIRKLVIALATSLHWFSEDAEGKAIERILKRLQLDTNSLDDRFFAGIWEDFADLAIPGNGFLIPPTPDSLQDELPNTSLQDLDTWSWDNCPISPSFRRILWNKEFLLYAQRGYLDSEFQGFDSTDIKASDDHNRPWDYDHLLPQSHFRNRKKWGKKKLELCQAWGGSIGNFHVLPFEINRARGNKPLDKFLESHPLVKSQVRPEALLSFTNPPERSDDQLIEFVGACQQRIVDIYRDWFDSLNISFLLGDAQKRKRYHDDQMKVQASE